MRVVSVTTEVSPSGRPPRGPAGVAGVIRPPGSRYRRARSAAQSGRDGHGTHGTPGEDGNRLSRRHHPPDLGDDLSDDDPVPTARPAAARSDGAGAAGGDHPRRGTQAPTAWLAPEIPGALDPLRQCVLPAAVRGRVSAAGWRRVGHQLVVPDRRGAVVGRLVGHDAARRPHRRRDRRGRRRRAARPHVLGPVGLRGHRGDDHRRRDDGRRHRPDEEVGSSTRRRSAGVHRLDVPARRPGAAPVHAPHRRSAHPSHRRATSPGTCTSSSSAR